MLAHLAQDPPVLVPATGPQVLIVRDARLVAVLLSMLALAGCHRIFPYHPAAEADSLGPADGAADLKADRQRSDFSRELGAGHDAAPNDGPAPEMPPLPGDASPGCTEDQGVVMASTCAAQNPACSPGSAPPNEDPDCDGLPGPQDPWPAKCNTLMLLEGFVSEPGPMWAVVGQPVWSCGKLNMPAGTSLTLDSGKHGLTSPSYLTELRFAIGIATEPDWSIGLRTASDSTTGQFQSCEVWSSKKYTSGNPGLHLVVHSTTTSGSGTWSTQTFDDTSGKTYILQVWSEANKQTCRLLDGQGTAVLLEKSLSLPLTTAGSIIVRASGRDATMDYVRVFDN